MATIDEIAKDSAADIVGTVAAALKEAVAKYGPDAVDLAMVAYRVDAIQNLLIGFVLMTVIAAIALAYRKLWTVSADFGDGDKTEIRGLVGIVSVFIAVPTMIGAFTYLLDVPVWLAAFGHPEILIATKALQAAGLM